MTTKYTLPQGPQEPEKTPPKIKVSRAVRRNMLSSKEQPSRGENSARPGLSNPTARPFLPATPQEQNSTLRRNNFAANNIDFLPTVALPVHNDNLPRQGELSPSILPPNAHYPGQSYADSAANNSPQTGYRAIQNNGGQIQPLQQQMPASQAKSTQRMGPESEIGDGHIILHRGANFYVRTTNRIGQRQNPLRRRSGHTTLLPKVALEQEKRTIASETRLMPNVAPINPLPKQAFLAPAWVEAFIVITGLLTALAAHAFNMFYYPQYGLDEGTYMSSAWAILHGEITPYAYGYGHPPLAWIQIAAWVQMTGGLFAFGNSINSGRVLMLVYATGSALLVYLIVRRLLGSRSIALLTMVLFSLSPLSITFQRQVLLDNVATFWLLLSLYFLVIGNSRLLFIALSAISYGLCLLSKEVLLLYFPVMIYAVWLHTTRFQRLFALIAFIYSVSALGSTFILMAILKGELLPTGWFPWDQHQHLSLLSTYIGQVQRGQSQGSILVTFQAWTGVDYYFIMASIATTLINLIAGWWNRKYLLLSLFALSYVILFVRNGVTFPFYIIPLLPFCAINIALVFNIIARWLGRFLRFQLLSFLFIFLVLAGTVVYDAQHTQSIFTLNLTSPQTRALAWIHNNIPHNAIVVINSYYFADLHEPGGDGVGDGAIYPYAHIYWNVAYDPEIHDTLLNSDWNNIDYIVTDTPMLYDIQTLGGDMQIVNIAFQHSSLLADFSISKNDVQNAIRIYKVNHTHAAPEVYQVLPWHAGADIADVDQTRDIDTNRKTI